MRACDKPLDPSSTRKIQIRCRDRWYVANSCSRQKAQSLDIQRAWPRNLRTVATESFFASGRGARMSTPSKSDGGMAPSVTQVAKRSTAWASATPTWTNATCIGNTRKSVAHQCKAQNQVQVANGGIILHIREDIVTVVAVMRVFRQVVVHCVCPPRECCPQCTSAEGVE